ncbi:hypothetical protein PMZ80_003604 [Knufia obscura]|uniref:Uncharacterized protein n=1 Tax=Knufia obscura TaxID=1635080 RepID=A0ABR0RUP1_9EURO|nr:hypothetical protein PMZ80_003604 [Knufia obscura]
MPEQFPFIEGDSLKKVHDQHQRRRIRSNLAKTSYKPPIQRKRSSMPVPEHVPGYAPIKAAPYLSPRTLVSTTRRDSFYCTGIAADDDFSQGVLDYCINELWPRFRPYSDYPATCVRYWLPTAARIGPVLPAIMLNGHFNRQLRTRNASDCERTLNIKGVALGSIKASLVRGIPYEHIDAMIFAILSVAVNVHASITDVQPTERSIFSPVWTDDQWVNIYAQLNFASSHFNAITALIERKGGIGKVEMYGTGWILFL